jgi:coenzyme PQQ precursor peptide PqqA
MWRETRLHIVYGAKENVRNRAEHLAFSCGGPQEQLMNAWTKPRIREIACGLEINAYQSAS